MSVSGFAGDQASPIVPAPSAASSLCFGTIGRCSSSRRPGANGSGSLTVTVRSSTTATCSGLPLTCSVCADPALHRVVVGEAEGEGDVGRGERLAVGEPDAGAQRDRVGDAVGGGGPAFREPGLDFVRDAVDANEPRLGEERHDLHRRAGAVAADSGCRSPARSAWRRRARRRPALRDPTVRHALMQTSAARARAGGVRRVQATF